MFHLKLRLFVQVLDPEEEGEESSAVVVTDDGKPLEEDEDEEMEVSFRVPLCLYPLLGRSVEGSDVCGCPG